MLNLRNFSMNALLFLMEPWVQLLGNMDWMKVAQEGKGLSQSKKKYLTMVIFFHSLKVRSLEIFIANFMRVRYYHIGFLIPKIFPNEIPNHRFDIVI